MHIANARVLWPNDTVDVVLARDAKVGGFYAAIVTMDDHRPIPRPIVLEHGHNTVTSVEEAIDALLNETSEAVHERLERGYPFTFAG